MRGFESLDNFLAYCDSFGTPAERRGARGLRTILGHRVTGNVRAMRSALRRIEKSNGGGSWAVEHAWVLCFDAEMDRVLGGGAK